MKETTRKGEKRMKKKESLKDLMLPGRAAKVTHGQQGSGDSPHARNA